MDWEHTKRRLEQALGITFQWKTIDEWPTASGSYESQGTIYFKAGDSDEPGILTLAVDGHELSQSERNLIEWIIQSESQQGQRQARKPELVATDEESRARLFGEWVAARLDEGELHSVLPDAAFLRTYQYKPCIAMLLDAEFKEVNRFTFKELRKLIDTYFESETVLFPLSEREWVVLASGSVLESANDDHEVGESVEELLESIALALHEMITEWLGDCRVSAFGMLHAQTNLLSAVSSMRDALQLGRLFHVDESVHLPWKLHLERLLYTMDDREKKKFLERLMKNAEHTTLDSEMFSTLQAFFYNDCNISETSKALYIHRNTLLYRLDKFKQATGMDVRNFHDAVLVHMALLLYKITK